MKKMLLLVLAIFTFNVINAQTVPNLVISEIMYNNPGAGNDTLEYIEIYNRGTAAVNMKDFYIKNAFRDTFPNVTLDAGKYYVVCFNSAFFKQKFGFDAGHQWRQGALNNIGETIELYSASKALIDSARYSSAAPWPAAANGNGSSLVLCDLNSNNDLQTSWSACTVTAGFKLNGVQLYATPGKENCNGTAVVTANDDNVTTMKNKAIKIAVLKNDLATKPVTVTLVSTPSAGGKAVLNTKKDTITFTPKTDFCGLDKFTYTISDGTLTATANVNVTVDGCLTIGTIAQARATDPVTGEATQKGLTYEVTGVVYSPNFRPNGQEFDLIDGNSGLIVYSAAKGFKYTATYGDKLTVRGKIDQFNGLVQLVADTIIKTGTATTFKPTFVVTKLDETTEAIIVAMNNLKLVDATKWTTGVGAGGFTVDATDGTNTVAIRIDKDIDLYNAPAPVGKFNIRGVGYQFDNATPFLDGYQLYPRNKADLQVIIGTVDPTIEAAVSVYPNPVQSELTIKMEKAIQNISITNVIGQSILNINNPSDTEIVNTSAWSVGMYFVTFKTNEGVFTTQIVK